jgi:transposase
MSIESGKTRRTHRVYSVEFKQQVVRETLEPGASVSLVARRHDINANVVFEWKRLYRLGKLALSDSGTLPTPLAQLLPVDVIDLPMQAPRTLPLPANESPKSVGTAPVPTCEIEIEIGERRVHIRGVPLEHAKTFLQECLR